MTIGPHGGAPQIAAKLCGPVVNPGSGVRFSGFDGSTAVFEAVALAVHLQDVDGMGQAVDMAQIQTDVISSHAETMARWIKNGNRRSDGEHYARLS